ncbi:MAG: DUF4388 domain-containing protein [Planctomycetes bacterium]|nr:DUF4388 domain-containing protein [Planctomycetota bacterium]
MGNEETNSASAADELKARLGSLVDAMMAEDATRAESDLVQLLTRVQALVDRKRKMEGSKNDTRDLLSELLFSRMRRGMLTFLAGDDHSKSRTAEWVMGSIFSTTTLAEFAQAVDRVVLSSHGNNIDFNFAGRTDFISLEEVLQMLAVGKHQGCLSIEKADNRLDIHMRDGRVVLLDPHHMIRRVVTSSDSMRHREIPEAAIQRAEAERTAKGTPILLSLHNQGVFRREEIREVMRSFGKEVLFDFMRESDAYFCYRRLDALPDYAVEHDLRLGVTSILLEGSKYLDDWRQLHSVYPNLDKAVEACDDMYARMGDLTLGVQEIKLIGMLNGEISPRGLSASLGLPLFDTYQLLVRLAREGVLIPEAGGVVLSGVTLSLEESMQEAFDALEANDDKQIRSRALDKVLGDEEPVAPKQSITKHKPPRHTALDSLFGVDAPVPSGGFAAPPKKAEKGLWSILKKHTKHD